MSEALQLSAKDIQAILVLADLIAVRLEARIDWAEMPPDKLSQRDVDEANKNATLLYLHSEKRTAVDDMANAIASVMFNRLGIRSIFGRVVRQQRRRVSLVRISSRDGKARTWSNCLTSPEFRARGH